MTTIKHYSSRAVNHQSTNLKHIPSTALLFYFFFLLFLPPGVQTIYGKSPNDSHTSSSIPDSLLQDRYIRHIYTAYPDSALQLLDIAETRCLPQLPQYRIDLLRSIVYEHKQMYTLKETYSRRALQNDSIKRQPGQRLQGLCYLNTALLYQGKYKESIQIAGEGITLARELGNKVVEYSLLLSMAQVSFDLKQPEEGFQYLQQIVEQAAPSDNVRELAQLSTAYGELMTALARENRLEEAIETGVKRKDLIRRMADMPGPPQGYIDQQYAYLYSKLAVYHQTLGHSREAAKYYADFLATAFSQTPQGACEGIPYLLLTKQYKQVLEMNRRNHVLFSGQDTLNYGYLNLLKYDAEACRGLGDYQQADALGQCMAVISDSIYTREKKNRAQELSTLFQLNEKEEHLQKAQTAARQRSILFVAACSIGVLLFIQLWNERLSLRKTRRLNRIATKQIDELLAQRKELRQAFAKENEKKIHEEEENRKEEDSDKASYADFMQMENTIIAGKLFLQPKFGRNELIQITRLDKNRLSKLIQKHTGGNITDYLNRLRVEHSITLMTEKPYLSIDAIASESGFNGRTTFYNAFSKAFEITPAQYRKNKGKANQS